MSEQLFKALFDAYYTSLCNYAFAIVHEKQAAEDVVQQLFLELWESKKYQKLEQPERFFLRSTKFKCIDFLRKSEKHQFSDTQEAADKADTHVIGELQEEDVLPFLHFLADRLPPKTKEVFLLSRQKGYSYKEIAQHLGISVKTVENQMSRALKKMRELLKRMGYFTVYLIFRLLFPDC